MQKYSVFNLIKNSFKGHKDWEVAWKDPTPKSEYDVIIIGGGGHGLATAYYLAKEHNITNVAIVEKGWIGGGNVGRNTTILRSNYMHDENGLFYEFGMDLWRTMSQDLNFNVMYSLIYGFLIGLIAFSGDLIESIFKRNIGVKDSGRLIPGHGGLLDRLDGYFIVIPFIYFIN